MCDKWMVSIESAVFPHQFHVAISVINIHFNGKQQITHSLISTIICHEILQWVIAIVFNQYKKGKEMFLHLQRSDHQLITRSPLFPHTCLMLSGLLSHILICPIVLPCPPFTHTRWTQPKASSQSPWSSFLTLHSFLVTSYFSRVFCHFFLSESFLVISFLRSLFSHFLSSYSLSPSISTVSPVISVFHRISVTSPHSLFVTFFLHRLLIPSFLHTANLSAYFPPVSL